MAIGPWQIAIIILVVLVFFGRGKVSSFMGDLAKGITAFKKGLKEDDASKKQVSDTRSEDTVSDGSATVQSEKKTEKTDA